MFFLFNLRVSLVLVFGIITKCSPVLGIVGCQEKHPHKNMECVLVLYHLNRYICSASLVVGENNIQYAITAASCVWDGENTTTSHIRPNRLGFYAWTHNYFDVEGIIRVPTKVVIHPEFDPVNLRNDIALLFIGDDKAITGVKEQFYPCNLPEPGSKPAGGFLMFGYGLTSLDAEPTGSVHFVEVPHVGHEACKKFAHESEQFCVGWLGRGGKGPCTGDEGAPVLSRHITDREYYLVGIYSNTRCKNSL